MPALPRFCAAYPQIHLDITVGDRHIDLIREGLDCVLRLGGLGDVPHVARRLAQLLQVTCARADYLQRNEVPLYHVARQLSAGSLREILSNCRPPALPLNALYPPNRQLSARIRAFIDWLEELFAGDLRASRF